jgi:ATP/maltotriose-dependent transcriptional regulator MalT
MDEAGADFQRSLGLLLSRRSDAPAYQLLLVVVQAELARALGHYARARQYTDTALALASTFGDRYLFAVLLIDQGMFARAQGWFEEVRRVFLLLRELEQQVAFPNLAEVNRLLAQQLHEQHMALPEPPSASAPPLLSEREKAVLRLVDEGLSSRDIAARLVVTTATVKKHLEHIYTRLDVHNRTSALARARRLNLLS